MTAAIIELNSLPDAIRAAAQDDDLLLVGGRRFFFFLEGGIKVGSEAFEFRSAGVDAFVDRRNAMLSARMPYFFRGALTIQAPGTRQPVIGESHALGLSQDLSGNRFHGMLLQLQLHIINFFELIEEPGIDR